jgi:hypothetical protein
MSISISQALAIELRDHPRLADCFRVVGSFGPSTIQPMVATSRLPDRFKAEARDLLVGLGDDPSARPTLADGFIQRFTTSKTPRTTIHPRHAGDGRGAGWTNLAISAIQ